MILISPGIKYFQTRNNDWDRLLETKYRIEKA